MQTAGKQSSMHDVAADSERIAVFERSTVSESASDAVRAEGDARAG